MEAGTPSKGKQSSLARRAGRGYLALRPAAAPGSERRVGPDDLVASAAYQPEPTAAAAARRFVRDTLQSWAVTGEAGSPELVDNAMLLTSELVTNAVVHAGTQVKVTCRLADGAVEVVVRDGQPARLVPEAIDDEPSLERTGGRGLLLPAALASAWGVVYGRSSKAVWFRLALAGVDAGLASGADDDDDAASELADAIGVTTALAAASRPARAGLGSPGASEPDGPLVVAATADSSYQDLLTAAVESARIAVGADAAFAMMADEDGDLRLRATAGSIPGVASGSRPSPPSVVTVPFVVDGRVTGLLSAASTALGRFGDPEAARLQWLADRSGPALQRAWLGELERIRRDRISALTEARGLLTGRLSRQEIMAMVGRAAVPRLAPWCAVLTPAGDTLVGDALAGDAGLRTSYARHVDDRLTGALVWFLDQVCRGAAPVAAASLPAARRAAPRPGRRWSLVAADMAGAPPEAAELAAGTAWCFPLGDPQDATGVFVIGDSGADRLPREVASLAADLACRVGLALDGAKVVLSGSARR
jgi:anti-sigma regulatory factor (Ser/Thr protein kinase)